MPNYQGVWSLSAQYQNAELWGVQLLGSGTAVAFGGVSGNGSPEWANADYINIATTGNAADFGDMPYTCERGASCASSTKFIYFPGQKNNSQSQTMSSRFFASGSDTVDFGSYTPENSYLDAPSGCSNSTRGVLGGGSGANSPYQMNTLYYITLASLGDASDFGDLSAGRSFLSGLASSTRGVFSGGREETTNPTNRMDYVTIASTGNATDFGDLTAARREVAGAASSTRGVNGGGNTGTYSNIIDYITIATTGNATDFGDLTLSMFGTAAASTESRAVWFGGYTGSTRNVIQYVTIATTGNAVDFGDLAQGRWRLMAASNAHGGLS